MNRNPETFHEINTTPYAKKRTNNWPKVLVNRSDMFLFVFGHKEWWNDDLR